MTDQCGNTIVYAPVRSSSSKKRSPHTGVHGLVPDRYSTGEVTHPSGGASTRFQPELHATASCGAQLNRTPDGAGRTPFARVFLEQQSTCNAFVLCSFACHEISNADRSVEAQVVVRLDAKPWYAQCRCGGRTGAASGDSG